MDKTQKFAIAPSDDADPVSQDVEASGGAEKEYTFRRRQRQQSSGASGSTSDLLSALIWACCFLLMLAPVGLYFVRQLHVTDLVMTSAIGCIALMAILYRQYFSKTQKNLKLRNNQLAKRLESLEDQTWEIRESEEIHRSLAEAFGDIVIHRDQNNYFTFFNAQYSEYFDEEHDIPEPNVEVGKLPVSRDILLSTKQGQRWFVWADLAIRDPATGKMGYRSVARDITQRKADEQNLIEARKRAEHSNEAKSRFLAMVSHEIRTPLNGVVGMTELLEDTELTSTQENYVKAIHSSGQTLLYLIEDLLDSAQIDAGQLRLAPQTVHLEDLVEGVVELLAPRAATKKLLLASHIDPKLPQTVNCDGGRLRQVLVNLVGNALKFTQTGGVSVHLQQSNASPGKVKIQISVSDSGPGLETEDQEKIFDEFAQVDNSDTREHGGVGLGLAISQKIINLMGGSISVRSRLGAGSQFSFELELPVVEQYMDGNITPVIGGQTAVLILPTNPASKAISKTLLANGYKVERFDSINAFASKPPQNDSRTIVITTMSDTAKDEEFFAKLESHLKAKPRVFLLGDAGEKETLSANILNSYSGWLTSPVRRSTLLAVLNGGIKDVKPTRAPAEKPIEIGEQSKNILLAEDNEINALLATSLLRKLGHSVKHVENGRDVVLAAMAPKTNYDTILMDLHMPILSGAEAIKSIRDAEKRSGAKPVKIIVLSADGQASAKDDALAAGADDFLTKPLDQNAVKRLVENAPIQHYAPLKTVLKS